MSNKDIEVYAKALKRKVKEEKQNIARKSTPSRDASLDNSLEKSREFPLDTSRDILREKPNHLPTRDEIQEFSFRLRDSLRVKVQAEVPHEWQGELEEIARELNVKKLELYRFIYGEFLGKIRDTKET